MKELRYSSSVDMGSAPQFSLRWNNYVNHVTDAFNLLRLENEMVDVTLCCDGGKIKAHKMLLSVCSTYFRQVFKETPCQHPVIIFKNVKYEDLNAIIYFMYHGEVSIFQEQLESFLLTAELLEVKGLTDGSEEDATSGNIIQSIEASSLDLSSKSKAIEAVFPVEDEPINLATMQDIKYENIPQTDNSPLPYRSFAEVDSEATDGALSDVNKSTVQPISSIAGSSPSEEMQLDNNVAANDEANDKSNPDSDMVLKFRCHMCPKGFKHPTSLTLHKDSHAGKTQCPVCHRSFSRSYDMRSHLQRIHRGKQLTIKEIRYKANSESVSSKQYSHNI